MNINKLKEGLRDNIFYRAEGKNINPRSIDEALDMYRDVNEYVLGNIFDFDILDDHYDTACIICTTYVNAKDKEWYSAVVNRDCIWWFDTPDACADYIMGLMERAREIKDLFK